MFNLINQQLPQEIIEKILNYSDFDTIKNTRELQSKYFQNKTKFFNIKDAILDNNYENVVWLLNNNYCCKNNDNLLTFLENKNIDPKIITIIYNFIEGGDKSYGFQKFPYIFLGVMYHNYKVLDFFKKQENFVDELQYSCLKYLSLDVQYKLDLKMIKYCHNNGVIFNEDILTIIAFYQHVLDDEILEYIYFNSSNELQLEFKNEIIHIFYLT